MKTIIFLTALLFSYTVSAQNYQPVDKGSSIKFIIKNAGMDVDGKFTGLEGSIRFNPLDLKGSSFSVSIDASTVNTDIDVRDNNLREAEYLGVKQFPRISIVSRQITRNAGNGELLVKATLTLKGISREIIFPFRVTTTEEGILLKGSFRINRNDFKIGAGSIVLSDALSLELAVFAKKI